MCWREIYSIHIIYRKSWREHRKNKKTLTPSTGAPIWNYTYEYIHKELISTLTHVNRFGLWALSSVSVCLPMYRRRRFFALKSVGTISTSSQHLTICNEPPIPYIHTTHPLGWVAAMGRKESIWNAAQSVWNKTWRWWTNTKCMKKNICTQWRRLLFHACVTYVW